MKAIITRYHGPTDSRGSRISATDGDGNRVTVPYPHHLSEEVVHRAAALALCNKMGWHGTLHAGDLPAGYVYVWHSDDADTFTV